MINEPQPQLSEREQAILRLVATGLSNQQIANQLGISINTVKVHLRNVFGKIGAASRTEATLYAVRTGLVEVERSAIAPQPAHDAVLPIPDAPAPPETPQTPAPVPVLNVAPPPAAPAPRRRALWPLVVALPLLLLGLGGGLWASGLLNRSSEQSTPSAGSAAASGGAPAPTWQALPALPAPRAAFATASLGDYIYAIGGQNATGVLDSVVRFDARAQLWTDRSRKPTPVADVRAVRLGDKLYVPGGRTSDNAVTPVLERYDPRAERWESLEPLPAPRSGYALAAAEGKLYLFGGWDGSSYRSEVFAYEPDGNTWSELPPMPAARAFAEAGVVEGNIYVVGGENQAGPLATNEVFTPARDGAQAWSTRAPLPQPRSRFGLATALSLLYVVGGDANAVPLKYETLTDRWAPVAAAPQPVGQQPGVVQYDVTILAIGGKLSDTEYADSTQSYEALTTIFLPQ